LFRCVGRLYAAARLRRRVETDQRHKFSDALRAHTDALGA
jgi:hypothetical protein